VILVFKRKLTNKEKKIIEKIICFIEKKHHKAEGHDYSHVLEVCKHSIEIGRKIKEDIDPFILICGALMHDIGRINATTGEFHGIDGGSRAEEFLESLIDHTKTIRKITKIVVKHTPTSMIKPSSPEEKVVFDADALERLGFMGMIRGIMGKKGTMEEIIEDRINKRLKDYDKLFYKESRIQGKKLHKETLKIVHNLKTHLKSRTKDLRKIESYKMIIEN